MPAAESQELLTGAQHGTIGTLLRQTVTRFLAGSAESRDFVVLDALAGEDAASQQHLARRIDVNRTTMVKLIDRLQNAGYVTRTRNPANRRTYLLSLTASGRTALEHMRQVASDHDARITAALTPAERERLTSLLNRLLPEPDQAAIPSVEHLVTQALYRLRRLADRELAGLATRDQDRHDRRRNAVELTDLGRERVPLLLAAMRQVEGYVRTVLGRDGRQELHELLTKILSTAPGSDS